MLAITAMVAMEAIGDWIVVVVEETGEW